jgi:hypothetical protein
MRLISSSKSHSMACLQSTTLLLPRV